MFTLSPLQVQVDRKRKGFKVNEAEEKELIRGRKNKERKKEKENKKR